MKIEDDDRGNKGHVQNKLSNWPITECSPPYVSISIHNFIWIFLNFSSFTSVFLFYFFQLFRL